MATRFRPYEPGQMLLMPPKLNDWLPADHLAHHVSDIVEQLDLDLFYAPYAGDGRRNSPYSPRMMVKILIYGYATGVCSSRGSAREATGGCGVPDAGDGELPGASDDVRSRRGTCRTFGTCFWR